MACFLQDREEDANPPVWKIPDLKISSIPCALCIPNWFNSSGFYSTDPGNKALQLKRIQTCSKLPVFAACLCQNGLRVPREMSALPDLWIVPLLLVGKSAVSKEQYLVFFNQLFWGRTCFSNWFWKGHNICTIKTILLSQRLFQRELSWNYTYLGASQCQQAENAAFSNHNCYNFSLCLQGKIKIWEKCSNINYPREYSVLQEQISVAVFKNTLRLWGLPLRNYRSACDWPQRNTQQTLPSSTVLPYLDMLNCISTPTAF